MNMKRKLNLKKLTKHEMCMAAAAALGGAVGTEDFNSEYENWYEGWLAGYSRVKTLGPDHELYMVCLHDDEGPNAYEGVCACYAHLRLVNGVVTFAWAEWAPAQ
jgi:hypothetical protein